MRPRLQLTHRQRVPSKLAAAHWLLFLLLIPTPTRAQPAAPAPAPGARPVSISGGEYLLKPNDMIAVSVFGEPDLATQDQIASDGSVMVPLAGRVQVRGRSAQGAAEVIRSVLAADYLVNPQVTVTVVEHSKQYFTVLGQVTTSGTFALPPSGRLPVLQAVGMAGGFTRIANPSKVEVKRLVGGREEIIKLDLRRLSREAGEHFDILPGDVITVRESFF